MGLNHLASFDKGEMQDYENRVNGQNVSDAEKTLIAETAKLNRTMNPMPDVVNQPIREMEITSGEAKYLEMQTQMLGRQHDGPTLALDLGTFCGRSAAAMARGMEAEGSKVISCDISDQDQGITQKFWKDEGVADRIEFRKGPGIETMQKMLDEKDAEGHPKYEGKFDMIFVDAEKVGYPNYYELAKKLLRPGGQVIFDNAGWSGRVSDPDRIEAAREEMAKDPKDRDSKRHDANLLAIVETNEKVIADKTVNALFSDAFDGLLIAQKRGFSRNIQDRRAQAATAEIGG